MKRPNTPPNTNEMSAGAKRDVLSPQEKLKAVEMIGLSMHNGVSKNTLALVKEGSLGTKDSAHDVFFAQDPKPREDMPSAIAIKRFRRPEAAHAELANLAEVRRRGFQTIEAAGDGIYPLGEMGTALVTRYITRFTTMNQIGWQNHYVGQEGYEPLSRTLREIGGYVGRLHGAGIAHGDLQLKNIGQVPAGRFVVFDVEGASFSDPSSEDHDMSNVFAGQCYEDLVTLGGSLVDKRFLAPVTRELFEQEVAQHLLTPYLDEGGNPAILEGYDRLMTDIHVRRDAMPSPTHAEIGRMALV